MTPEELKTFLDNIVGEVNLAGDFIGTLDPAIIPYIVLGKAIDKMIPGVVYTVDKWIQGNTPTSQEKADMLQQLSVLGNPDLP